MPELRRINPLKCRMWSMHDRLGDGGNTSACYALIQSIKAQGQKHPVLGRRVTDTEGFEVELIYGARRLAAARELGIDLLVKLRDIDDRNALIEMDIENRVREDISPYERGISYKGWLRSRLFGTQAEIAKALGVSESQICRLLKYADLPTALLAAFKSPHEIREEWAGTLSGLCKDPRFREGMLRRARSIKASANSWPAQEVYETLVSDGKSKAVTPRARDEVVKGSRGRPLFRIRFLATSVHLILPREGLSGDALEHVSEQLRVSLESSKEHSMQPQAETTKPHTALGIRSTGDAAHPRPTLVRVSRGRS